jgi:hypothetical protein
MKELDLHGLTHDVAVDRAEDFVLMESHDTIAGQFRATPFQCRIITGKSDTLSKKVIKMLETYDFRWYIPTWNTGEIIVSE